MTKSDEDDASNSKKLEKAKVVDITQIADFIGQGVVNLRDLPSFSGTGSGEDADDFIQRFERCGYAHNWGDKEKLKHFYLAVTKNAMHWHEANKTITDWNLLKQKFLSTFGKTEVDFDIQGEAEKLLASENPINYVFRMLSRIQATDPNAQEDTKVTRLYEGLPPHLKIKFVVNRPTTIDGFINRLRDINRKAALGQTGSSTRVGKSSELEQLLAAQQQMIAHLCGLDSKTISEPLKADNKNAVDKVHFLEKQQSEQRKEIDWLTEQLEALEMSAGHLGPRESHDNWSNLNRNVTADGRKICYMCGVAGHIARFCEAEFYGAQPGGYGQFYDGQH